MGTRKLAPPIVGSDEPAKIRASSATAARQNSLALLRLNAPNGDSCLGGCGVTRPFKPSEQDRDPRESESQLHLRGCGPMKVSL
jgi:hypothetical protein